MTGLVARQNLLEYRTKLNNIYREIFMYDIFILCILKNEIVKNNFYSLYQSFVQFWSRLAKVGFC